MQISPRCLLISGAAWLIFSAAAWSAQVELELLMEAGFPPQDAHRWMESLRRANLDRLRIRSARSGERAEIQQSGQGDSAIYRVKGVLTRDGLLRLPGARYRMEQSAAIAQWAAQLKQGGQVGLAQAAQKPKAFGLLDHELVAVHEALSLQVFVSTKDRRCFDALKEIAANLPLPFYASAEDQRLLLTQETIPEEMKGLSTGTVMAAILRPLGLVVVPEKLANGDLRLRIMDVRQAQESWPVGWPPEKSPRETLPELFNFLDVEIDDTPLSQALEAVGGRIETPLLYDHNSLARHRIDPAETNVSLPSGRTYYKSIMDKLLNQAKLKSELRVDEAGKPFLWISTLRR